MLERDTHLENGKLMPDMTFIYITRRHRELIDAAKSCYPQAAEGSPKISEWTFRAPSRQTDCETGPTNSEAQTGRVEVVVADHGKMRVEAMHITFPGEESFIYVPYVDWVFSDAE